jgi:hypothetical protein
MNLKTLSAMVVGMALALPLAAAPREVLPFISDDYSKALTQAKAKKRPIFVEAWAPW